MIRIERFVSTQTNIKPRYTISKINDIVNCIVIPIMDRYRNFLRPILSIMFFVGEKNDRTSLEIFIDCKQNMRAPTRSPPNDMSKLNVFIEAKESSINMIEIVLR